MADHYLIELTIPKRSSKEQLVDFVHGRLQEKQVPGLVTKVMRTVDVIIVRDWGIGKRNVHFCTERVALLGKDVGCATLIKAAHLRNDQKVNVFVKCCTD